MACIGIWLEIITGCCAFPCGNCTFRQLAIVISTANVSVEGGQAAKGKYDSGGENFANIVLVSLNKICQILAQNDRLCRIKRTRLESDKQN